MTNPSVYCSSLSDLGCGDNRKSEQTLYLPLFTDVHTGALIMKLERKNTNMKKLSKNSKSESQKLGNIGKFRGKEGIFFSLAETVHILVLSETENRDICSFK